MFYNTIGASKEDLAIYQAENKKENKLILKIFELNKTEWFTPYQIQAMVAAITGFEPLIGNVRRAITDLQKENKLIKSETACAPGKYSKPNHMWLYNGD